MRSAAVTGIETPTEHNGDAFGLVYCCGGLAAGADDVRRTHGDRHTEDAARPLTPKARPNRPTASHRQRRIDQQSIAHASPTGFAPRRDTTIQPGRRALTVIPPCNFA